MLNPRRFSSLLSTTAVGSVTARMWQGSIAVLLGASLLATPAHAQDQGTAPDSAQPESAGAAAASQPAEDPDALEDPSTIVVTAQRRNQQLQDVPISITALTGETLSETGVSGTERLSQVTPGLNYTRNRFFSQPYVRGVGSSSTSIGDEPSIATYVDGVYISGVQTGFMDFLNVDRVEVLKGPQGTLFGRNATGGAISIITRLPSYEPELRMRATYGRFNEITLQGYGATGISDKVAIGVAASWDQRDGFLRNLVSGQTQGDRDGYIVRGRLLLQPTERLRIVLTGDISRRDDPTGNNYRILNRNTRSETGVPPINTTMGPYEIRGNFENYTIVEQRGVSMEVQYEADPLTIISQTSYRTLDFSGLVDSDSTESTTNVSHFEQNNSGRDIQQEFRVVSSPDSRIQWLGGVFFFDSRTRYDPLNVVSSRIVLDSSLHTQAMAAFADITVPLGGGVSIIGGARYSVERKRLFQSVFLAAANLTRTSGPRVYNEEDFSPRAVLQWQPNEDNLVYASYSRGFKSGGFNQSGLGFLGGFPDPAFLPETINAYEIGYKRTLRGVLAGGVFNIAAFHYDYSNLQVQIVTPPPQGSGTAVIQNASGLTIDGVEAELALNITSRFNIRLAGSYIDARYTDFPNAIVNIPRACPVGVTACGNDVVVRDITGNQAVKAPRFTGNASATYRAPLAGGYSLTFSGNVYYNSGFPWEPNGRLRESSYALVNAQVEFAAPEDRWTVTLFGRNLTDTRYLSAVQLATDGDKGATADPITYGIALGVRF